MPFIFDLFAGTLLNSFAGLFATLVQVPSKLLLDFVNIVLQAVFMTTTGTTTTTGS